MSGLIFVLAFHGSPGGSVDFLPIQKSMPSIQIETIVRPGYGRPLSEVDVKLDGTKQLVFGYSWGGIKALEYAGNHRDQVKGVVWFAPYLMEKPKSTFVYWLMKNKFSRDILLTKKAKARTEEFVSKSAAPQVAPADYRAWALANLANAEALGTSVIEKNDFFENTNEVLAKFNASQIPLYVIVGSEDQSFDRNQSEFYGTLRKTKEIVIPGAGHLVIWTNTTQVIEELKKLFQ